MFTPAMGVAHSVLCKLYYRSRCCCPAGGIRVCNSGKCWVSTRGLAHLCLATDSLSTHPPSWLSHWAGKCRVPGSWAGISRQILYLPPCGRRSTKPYLPLATPACRMHPSALYRGLEYRVTCPRRELQLHLRAPADSCLCHRQLHMHLVSYLDLSIILM